jgi:hypothetical protein
MAFRLRCQTCREAFPFDPKTEDWPDKCPLCGTHVGFNDRADDDVCMPSIRTARAAATDKVYRDIEAGSEERAKAAAEMTGASVEEMSSLKISNLNSTLRAGDIAAPPVTPQNNQVLAFMEQTKVGGFQGNGAEWGSAVQTGPEPNAGARMRTALQSHHTNVSGGAAVSDRPALETMQPGYRRRG